MKTSKKIMALALTGALAASSVSVVSVSAEPKKADNWRLLLPGYRKGSECYKSISGIPG